MPLSITQNIYTLFNSVYRPIIVKARDTDPGTAYLRGELFMETGPCSGTFASTGVLMNGYSERTDPDVFSFNFMEYVRHYVSKGIIPLFPPVWGSGSLDVAKFQVHIWSVKYSAVDVGTLYDDMSRVVRSKKFIAHGLVTSETDGMDSQDFYNTMDRYVLGPNKPQVGFAVEPDTYLPCTNAPNRHTNIATPFVVSRDYHGNQMINLNDYFTDSLYFNFSYTTTYTRLIIVIATFQIGASSGSLNWFEVSPSCSTFFRQPLHPDMIEFQYLLSTGSVLGKLVDNSGNLKSSAFAICPFLGNASLSTQQFLTNVLENDAWFWYDLSDETNNGGCSPNAISGQTGQGGEGAERTKFLFKNMRGGYDFFNCYGTHTKEVTTGGTMYDNHKPSPMRGLHSRKHLWKTREDVYSVTTQALPIEETIWLEQLLTSPQVWVQKELTDAMFNWVSGRSMRERIIAINIDMETFAVHTTEDRFSYISFKYKLSEPISTQKG